MDEEALRENRSDGQSRPREGPLTNAAPSGDLPQVPNQEPSECDLIAIHRYLIQLLVDRDEADAIYQQFAPLLQQAVDQGDPMTQGRSRLLLRASLIQQLDALRRSGRLEFPIPAIDRRTEEARFDSIWRMQLLERTWQRLKDFQANTGQPLHLALRQRSEAPGLSVSELTDRISLALDRPLSIQSTQNLLRQAQFEFSRILLEEVVATLAGNPPFELIERELIETNLLAFCREAIGGLRSSSRSHFLTHVRRRSSPE